MKTQNKGGAAKWLLVAVSAFFLIVMLILPLVYVLITSFR